MLRLLRRSSGVGNTWYSQLRNVGNTTGGRGVIFVLSMQNFGKFLLTFSLSSH